VASSVSFGIYFAVAGVVFPDDYKVPPCKFEDWQLLAGFMLAASRLFARLKIPPSRNQRWAAWCSESSAWHCR
jgi:hypothetical protein